MICWEEIKAGETRDRSETLKATHLAFHLYHLFYLRSSADFMT